MAVAVYSCDCVQLCLWTAVAVDGSGCGQLFCGATRRGWGGQEKVGTAVRTVDPPAVRHQLITESALRYSQHCALQAVGGFSQPILLQSASVLTHSKCQDAGAFSFIIGLRL